MEVSLYAGERLVEIKKMTLGAEETALCFFEDFSWQGEALRSEISSELRLKRKIRFPDIKADHYRFDAVMFAIIPGALSACP